MIEVSEADKIISQYLYKTSKEEVKLMNTVGRVVAQDVVADRDFPPYDRVTMDGVALSYESYGQGHREFRIAGVCPAGSPQNSLDDPHAVIEVMTGAVLPKNTDTVIPYEQIKVSDGRVEIQTENVELGQNIHGRGEDHKKGEILLKAGKKIGPTDVGVLATVGMNKVSVWSLPRVAIVSSGDELVDVSDTPLPHQIRSSNLYTIASRIKSRVASVDFIHLPDDVNESLNLLKEDSGSYDVLIMSGGVSKGKFDFIPEVLERLGVKKHFHKVRQRPGKPFWFGTSEKMTVFALPGNPVSAYTCLCRYFLPWLEQSLFQKKSPVRVRLDEAISFKPDLTYYAQVKLSQNDQSVITARHSSGNGSGDLVNPTQVDGFIELPSGKDVYEKGEIFDYYSFTEDCFLGYLNNPSV